MPEGQFTDAEAALRTAAETYCIALHNGDGDALRRLCYDRFHMTWVGADGAPYFFDYTTFTDRVGARDGFAGAPDFEIHSIDVDGSMGQVKLSVAVPPRRYTDFLGFQMLNGEWRLIQKLFRQIDGPALEG